MNLFPQYPVESHFPPVSLQITPIDSALHIRQRFLHFTEQDFFSRRFDHGSLHGFLPSFRVGWFIRLWVRLQDRKRPLSQPSFLLKAAVGSARRPPAAVDAIGHEALPLLCCNKLSSSHSLAFLTMHRTPPSDNKKALGRIISPKGFQYFTRASGYFVRILLRQDRIHPPAAFPLPNPKIKKGPRKVSSQASLNR